MALNSPLGKRRAQDKAPADSQPQAGRSLGDLAKMDLGELLRAVRRRRQSGGQSGQPENAPTEKVRAERKRSDKKPAEKKPRQRRSFADLAKLDPGDVFGAVRPPGR